MRKSLQIIIATILFCNLFIVGNSFAGGATSYPNGLEDFTSGVIPPPGVYYIHYLYTYHASQVKDNNGHKYSFGPFSEMEITSIANALRFLYVTKLKLFGADIASTFVIPIPYVEYDFKHEFNIFDVDKGGLADIAFDPFLMAWHTPNFHFAVGPDIYVPIGRFDHESDLLNLSTKVWTLELATAFTILLGKFDISSKFMYDFSSKNNDHIVNIYEAMNLNRIDLIGKEKKLSPGQEFHFDYGVGYNITKWFEAGINGYFYHQTTDDKINDEKVRNMKGMTFAIGPAVKFSTKNIFLIFKNLWELETENRPQGYVLSGKFAIAF